MHRALGNHDNAPANPFPRNKTALDALDSQWVFDIEKEDWSDWDWIGAAASEQVSHSSGSIQLSFRNHINKYGLLVQYKQVVLILLQTDALSTSFYFRNKLPDHSRYPRVQEACVPVSIRVGPGSPEIPQIYRWNVIRHTHRDQIEISYSNYSDQNANTVTSVAWIAPGLTRLTQPQGLRCSIPIPIRLWMLDYTAGIVVSGLSISRRSDENASTLDQTEHCEGLVLNLGHVFSQMPGWSLQDKASLRTQLEEIISLSTE
ncbi:hypothetical protein C8J56DRAFT_1038109 [Mycena floridula]|nr:hypothetical protein C8J56DRAFT_1038109 [Mycena floridula]